MTHRHKLQGFTLIELLVVVLIIGILAAIALPQYNRVVIKAKIYSDMALARGILDAQDLYFLEHGEYTCDLEKLDFLFHFDKKVVTEDDSFFCGKRIDYHIGSGGNSRYFAAEGGGYLFYAWKNTGVRINYYGMLGRSQREGHFGSCYSMKGDRQADAICKSIGPLRQGVTSVQDTPVYWVN